MASIISVLRDSPCEKKDQDLTKPNALLVGLSLLQSYLSTSRFAISRDATVKDNAHVL